MSIRIYLIMFLLLLAWVAPAHSKESKSIDPRGDFFLQRTSGDTYNCGPLVALTARKYADDEFDSINLRREIAKARDLVSSYKNKSGNADALSWWEFRDIRVYLRFMGVGTKVHKLPRGRNPAKDIQQMIAENKMLIVNVNMNDIPYGKETGKPYSTFYIPGGWGHYLAIVGYEKKNDEMYFKVHDSFSPRGKNRLYSAKQIVRAMRRFAPAYLEVKRGV